MTVKNKTEGIKEDIRQGKEYLVIALKWETTVDNVKNIASKMGREGEKLIDRRTEEWETMQVRKRDDLNSILEDLKRETIKRRKK